MSDLNALTGVRVVDFSRQMAGPYAGVVLSDFGADVVKVEMLPAGDPSRHTGIANVGDQSAFYLTWNRGKRGVALDLRQPEGLAIARRLAARADVVIENFRPGVADVIGIGYNELAATNQRLVYCSVSGFGPTGPLASFAATDPLIQGMSGVMAVTGEVGGPPALVGIPVADFIGASLAVQGILLALAARERTGSGQKVDTTLLFGLMSALQPRLATYWATGEEPQRHGSAHNQVVPYQAFQTADGWAMAGTWGDGDWPRFCEAVGLPHLADDARFATRADRSTNRTALEAELAPAFRTRPTAEWQARFHAAGALFGPILSFTELFDHPHVKESGMVQTVEHPTLGPIPQFASPIWLSATPASIRRPPPLLGEHTAEVLHELDFDEQRIGDLARRGVVAIAEPSRAAGPA